MLKQEKKAFTLVELLTVISIITLIISLLVPALNQVNKIAKDMKQRAQFHSIEVSLDIYKAEYEKYPVSFAHLGTGKYSCGAQTLAEALLGRDLQGFDPKSDFDALYDYTKSYSSTMDVPYYGVWLSSSQANSNPAYKASLARRKGPYLNLQNAAAYDLVSIYGTTRANSGDAYPGKAGGTAPAPVISDIYFAKKIQIGPTGSKVTVKTGSPVLYFKADNSKINIDYVTNLPSHPEQMIYNFEDNRAIVELGKVKARDVSKGALNNDEKNTIETLSIQEGWGKLFYEKIRNKNIVNQYIPYNKDKYILWSAGFDGDFGTNDDIFNFGK